MEDKRDLLEGQLLAAAYGHTTHMDLRQDERAMQLFGLVNALLYHNRSTGSESHDLSIQRYAVVPLSPTAGN